MAIFIFFDVEKSQTTPFKAWTFRASKNPNKPTPLGVGKIQGFFDFNKDNNIRIFGSEACL